MYSLRHSFEDRMIAAGVDDRIRRHDSGGRIILTNRRLIVISTTAPMKNSIKAASRGEAMPATLSPTKSMVPMACSTAT